MAVNAEAGLSNQAAPDGGPSAGALLKAAREKQGLHIAALAAAIKVSPRKLEALEADRWSDLPDATFTRALAQTVCRTLKIDPRPVLERLPAAGPQRLVPPDAGLNEPFREAAARSARTHDDSPLAKLAMRPMLWGAGVLLLASVGLYLAPLDAWLARAPAAAPAALPASTPASAPGAVAAAASAPASGAMALVPPGADTTASAPAAAPPMVETVFSAPAPGTDATAVPAAGMLQLRVREASWIEVRDARGASLLSRTVSPGEQVGLDGALPLVLVIGNAAATDLVFRGQPVDLAARTRDNVARLQLP